MVPSDATAGIAVQDMIQVNSCKALEICGIIKGDERATFAVVVEIPNVNSLIAEWVVLNLTCGLVDT
jgi:tRNA-binding EMAP/Myf-like protein